LATAHQDRPALWAEIRILLLAAMAIFAYTVSIGILNGTDLVDFDQRRILSHVHGGTLGWLTLGVIAAALWLFGQGPEVRPRERQIIRGLTAAAILTVAAYVLAFALTYGGWRPALGTATTAVIACVTGWVIYRATRVELGVPHLGFLAALGTSIAGGVLGVLLGLEAATGDNWLPEGGRDAHPATMVVGFLVPVGLAMAEWAFFFPGPPKATRLGAIQMAFPFAGGFLLMLSLLLDVTALAPIAILLQVAGFAIFAKRLWPQFRRVSFAEATPGRHAIMAAAGLAFVIALAQYFVIRYEGDFDRVPSNHLLALDHAQFIGLMTNAIFAMLMAATIGARGNRVDQAVFLLVNVGITGFVIGLLGDSTPLKRTFTPLMGTGLTLGLAVYALRLLGLAVPVLNPASASKVGAAGR
jgi:hypothetical protein